jgi:hypothetical protein
VPWTKVGSIALGEPRAQVARDYATHRYHVSARYAGGTQGYYVLHGGRVEVDYVDARVNEIHFTTPYFRTAGGFGVGSSISLGPCHRTHASACEHWWHGFVWDAWVRDKPCSCWTKVGTGAHSLPATGANFLKPWTFLYARRGRVTSIGLAWRFVD